MKHLKLWVIASCAALAVMSGGGQGRAGSGAWVVSYGTYIFGSGRETVKAVSLDRDGNAYVAGTTGSRDFHATTRFLSPRARAGRSRNVFVLKLDRSGRLVFSTVIGGTHEDTVDALSVDAGGNILLAGHTYSKDFPVKHAFQTQMRGRSDAFVCRLDRDGASLHFSTFLGGSSRDEAIWPWGRSGVAAGPEGAVTVVGSTSSPDFPLARPAQAVYGGGDADLFVARLSPSGETLEAASFLGSDGSDIAGGLAIGADGALYVSGSTDSAQLNAQTRPGGEQDAFVARLSTVDFRVQSLAYAGGSGSDATGGMAVAPDGSVYLAGTTQSEDLPVTPGAFQTKPGGVDGFLARYDGGLTRLLAATYLGGDSIVTVHALAVDESGCPVIGGSRLWGSFPLRDAVDTRGDDNEAFVARLNASASELLFGTYLGGNQVYRGGDVVFPESAHALATGPDGEIVVGGETTAPDFPITPGAYQTNVSFIDGFLVRLSPGDPSSSGALRLSRRRVKFGSTLAGSIDRRVLLLKNTGRTPLEVEVGDVGPPFRVVEGTGKAVLRRGETRRVRIWFQPEARGLFEGNLAIRSSDPGRRLVNLPVEGFGR